MAAESLAAQRFHKNSPTPAITYAKPATKLNQRNEGNDVASGGSFFWPTKQSLSADDDGDDAERGRDQS
jgi:hypothetical protein